MFSVKADAAWYRWLHLWSGSGTRIAEMATHFAPVFRTPLTDMQGGLLTHQRARKCADFEMRAMECLEAYGVQKGRTRCVDYLDDLRECAFQTKQLARVSAMRHERHRQWLMGERSSKDRYAPAPQADGF
ncbi:hypothetical protein Pcinc_015020 [Petrolisthes cinctipes]|uniref:Complex I-15 kDa n=1 Tax=Petrolisthes cinctipes TaxID=88211 RepID=A0AAE1FZ78_PETCI|nr:hypothetical protein Pcinc_015020 [Petrolisthes cinctipes]